MSISNQATIDYAFDEIDTDKNNQIDFIEFSHVFTKNFSCPMAADVKSYAKSV